MAEPLVLLKRDSTRLLSRHLRSGSCLRSWRFVTIHLNDDLAEGSRGALRSFYAVSLFSESYRTLALELVEEFVKLQHQF